MLLDTNVWSKTMIPSLLTDLRPQAQTAEHADHAPDGDTDVFGALLEALAAPDRYRLIQRDGELFIEPVI